MTRVYLAPGRLDRRRGRRYNVQLGSPSGKQIVSDALDPEFTACRVLSARGVTGALEVWHVGSAFAAMRIGDIAAAARLTVREEEFRRPRLVRYRPRFEAAVSSPATDMLQGREAAPSAAALRATADPL